MNKEKLTVLGGGTWGATIAAHLGGLGHDVMVWEFVKEVAEYLEKNRSLKTLPKLKLPASVHVTNNIADALKGRKIIFSVTPSHTVRSTFKAAAPHVEKGAMIVSATKGIEMDTNKRMTEVIKESCPSVGDVVVLTGPSHAEEVSLGQPVVLVSASTSKAAAGRVRDMMASTVFRIYTSDDPIGAELGGSIKNVYAVASGMIDGLKLGDNTKAALMTRGLAEMTRLGAKMGAKPVTFFGLSGLGDLIVTCGSQHSRNRAVGEKIGQGKSLEAALKEMTMVAEGINSTKSGYQLAQKHNIEMPIVNEMYKILFENKSPKDSMKDLMTRQVGAEMEGIVL